MTGTADKFIGGDLYALLPISLMSSPSGKYLRTVKTNNYIGTIQSYVVNNGVVWWELFDKTSLSTATIGFVMHEEGKFDKQKLENSLIALEAKRKKEIDEAVEKRKEDNNIFSFMDDIEGMMKTAMYIIILITILNLVKK